MAREPDGEQRVVLVVERESAIGELLAGAVTAQSGYQAVLVADAAVALATAEAVHIDLAIIDLDLPGMSGIELVDHLRTSKAGLPVLLVSDGSAEHTAAMRERRFATFVQKPFEIDTLISLVRRLVPPGPAAPA